MCLTFVGQVMASTIVPYNMMGMKNIMSQEQVSAMSAMLDKSDKSAMLAKSMIDDNDDSMTTENNHLSSHDSVSKENCCDTVKGDCCNTSTADCCDGACHCFTSGYLSLFSLHKTSSNTLFIDLPSKIISFSTHVKSEVLTSLYRPPILMS